MKHLLTITLFAAMAVCCGSNKNTEQTSQGSVTTIGVEEFAKVIGKKNVRLIDVRTPKEYAEGHIDNAINIDVQNDSFEAKAVSTLPKDKTIALYCRSGRRSKNAAKILSANGYTVVELNSGYNGWKKSFN